jgi:hypothetical protein
VPLFIVLAWAVILWTAMQITNRAALNLRARICTDAILAVLLDLAFDATAIRHGFWTWQGFDLNQAWLVSRRKLFWLATGFIGVFGLYTCGAKAYQERAVSSTRSNFPCATCCIRTLSWRGSIGQPGAAAFGWDAEDPATDTLALIGFFVVFAGVVLASRWRAIEYSIARQTNDTVLWFSHACRVSFHVFAIAGLWVLPASALLAQQRPALLAVAGLVWLCDWLYGRGLKATSG